MKTGYESHCCRLMVVFEENQGNRIEQHLIIKNPTQGCALPKVEHKEMKTLTADQLSTFFQEARDSGVYELYYLDLATGLTAGRTAGPKVDRR